MNKAYLAVGLILLSVIALAIINVITSYSTGNELDYYLLRETADASMEDALDPAFQREGLLRIDKEKFVESFVKRFSTNVDKRKCYNIKFYDINELPPKATIRVSSATAQNQTTCPGARDGRSFEGEAVKIETEITTIMETNYKKDDVTKSYLRNPYKVSQD